MKDKKLSDEKARRSTGAATDTGDPKRIEDDARFQALLLDTVEQAVIAADFDGLITYWNKFAEKLFGWSAAEVLNKDVLKYTSSKISRRAAGKVMRQLQEGKNWTGELTLKRRDGATFPAQIMNSSVQNEHGDRIGMLSIITDISESRRAKKENIRLNSQIAAQRERLNTIIANIPGVVWETRLTANQADDCGFVSEYVEKMTGYTIAEWMQEPDFWLKIIHPEDREHAALEIAAFIENKGSGVQQCRWTAKDGAVVWVETQMVLIADDDGQPISLRGISIDVSGRKSMEEALQKSEEQLRQSQKLESVGRLAGGIAHDFNNMLTAINGYSDLILRELGDDDSLRKKVLEIKKAGERSAALTHQLLAFSRRQVLQPKLIDLNKIVTEMSQMLHRLIGEDVQLNLALDVAPSCVEADPGQLSQVIMNLVVNARDAMPQGGELTVETEKVFLKDEPVALFAASKTDEPFVMLRVIDTGTGIDEKTLRHIFEPFFTTKQAGAGTGLGLSTVYGIVKQSGGYIWVNSAPDKGAEFRVYLPFVEEKEGGKKEKKRVEQFPHGTETILLVEDEEMVRDLTRRILEICGYTVIEARNGIEALKICRETDCQIDLLMTDVVMPQMNGRELSEKMNEIMPQVRTLFTSGYMNDRLLRDGISVEDVDFIRKPFAPDVLARKIRELLNRKS